jgi:hypothetical protein
MPENLSDALGTLGLSLESYSMIGVPQDTVYNPCNGGSTNFNCSNGSCNQAASNICNFQTTNWITCPAPTGCGQTGACLITANNINTGST